MSAILQKRLIASVIEHIRARDVDEVIIAADPYRWSELRILAAELRVVPFPISFMPVGSIAELFRRPSHNISGTICVELQRGPLTRFEHAVKRCVDVIGAGLVLILLFPLLILVTIAIKSIRLALSCSGSNDWASMDAHSTFANSAPCRCWRTLVRSASTCGRR